MSEIPKAGAYVVAKLRALDGALGEAAPRVVASGSGDELDPEAVHDLRVAIRRLRTLLKMARDLFGRWHTGVVRAAFAEVMRATGELRDEEVLEETLAGAATGPVYEDWLGQRKSREGKLRSAVVQRIERGDLERARLLLKALIVFPVEPARKTVERSRRRVEKQRDVEPEDVLGMHDLRIAYKELRYSIELLSDALPIDARAQLEPATVFQKRLGELHDVDVAIDVVNQTRNLPDEQRAEALATLATMRAKRVRKYLREVDPLGAAQTERAEKAPRPAASAIEDEPTVYLRRVEADLLPASALAALAPSPSITQKDED